MTAFLLDNFTGATGLLTGHSSDTGQTWIDAPTLFLGSDTAPTHLKLNGSGTVGMDGSGIRSAAAYSSATPPTADYYVQARILSAALNNEVFDFFARYVNSNGHGVYAEVTPGTGGGGNVSVDVQGSAGSSADFGIGFYTVADNTNFLFRMEVQGAAVRIYLDGVLVQSFSSGSVIPTLAGAVGFAVGYDGSSAAYASTLDSFEAGTFAGAFWTDFVQSIEVLV